MAPHTRLLASLLALDLSFNPLFAYFYLGLIGVRDQGLGLSMGVFAATIVGRWLVFLALAGPHLRPLAAWHGEPDPQPEVILRAARAAYELPLRLTLQWGVLNALQWLVMTAALTGALGFDLPQGTALTAVLITLTVGLGSLQGCLPLLESMLAPTLRELSLTARSRGIALRGRGLSFRARLMGMAILLGTTPICVMSAITYSSDIENNRQKLAIAAEALVAHDAAARGGAPTTDQPLEGAVRFTVGVDGTIAPAEAAQIVASRPALDAWLRDAQAAGTVGGASSDLASGGAIALRRLADGTALGVVVAEGRGASSSTIVLLAVFLGLIVFWSPMSALFIARSTAEPVAKISEALGRMRRGQVSQVEVIPVLHQDEVGMLAESFNDLRDQLLRLIDQANEVSDGNLAVEIEIEGELGDAFRSQVASLREMVVHTAQSASQLAAAAAEMYAAAQEQEASAQQQSSGVEEVARTMDSLLQAATHISESTAGVLSKAERTRATTGSTAERIAELSGHAGRIAEILEVIREIADRSDLLALNASLEGTRAGEAGRGFTLVAAEMRKLAERITASVHDIKELVADVRASVSATVMATEESTKLAEGTTESARQISFVTQQQRSGTEQAGTSMRDVATMISQSLSATQEIRSLAGTLKQQADGLTALIGRFRSEEEAR